MMSSFDPTRRARSVSPRRPRSSWGLLVDLALGVGAALIISGKSAAQTAPFPKPERIRVGFSSRTLGEVNRNDFKASLKVWVETIIKQRQLNVDSDPQVYDTVAEFESALKGDQVDIISVPADEFVHLMEVVPLEGLFSTTLGGSVTETYVLLVRRGSPARSLADLKNGRIATQMNQRAALVTVWLDAELLRAGEPPIALFFRTVIATSNINRVILPVFFDQLEACVVSRRAYETACELNPQIGRELRILASSPELIPAIGCYRADILASELETYRTEVLNLNRTPIGRQLLTLFQCESIVEISERQFAPTRFFLEEYARLKTNREKGPRSL